MFEYKKVTADQAPAWCGRHALTIDVEDWFHPELVRDHVPESKRSDQLRNALDPLLELLSARSIKATFFLLGEVALAHPGLVRELHGAGHEIACHGMTHIPLWRLDAEALQKELRDFRAVLAAIDPAIRVRGYRAPTFSLDQRTAWALQVLGDEGFTYDSSIFPFKNHVYGVAGAPLSPYRPDPVDLTRHSEQGPVLEFPLSVMALWGCKVPVSGGFYLRIFPYQLVVWALRRIGRERPFVIYCHPWECDPETPKQHLRWVDGFITYRGIAGARSKLARLLDEFAFTRMDQLVGAMGEDKA